MPLSVTHARALFAVLLTALGGMSAGCAALSDDPITSAVAAGLPVLHPTVIATTEHDTTAWTEGLEIADGVLYEGTGLAGRSELRRLDPATGRVLHSAPLPDNLYGEGITVLHDRIWQLTYRDRLALRWSDGASPSPPSSVPYRGEGWGLCHTADGTLVASDGTDRLRLLSADTLTELGSLAVTVDGRPLAGLNELDCGAGAVWANVYPSDWLARISLPDGTVTAVLDAGRLLPPDLERGTDVLNGIAAVPGTDQFLLTGKFWPKIYRVRFTG